MRVACFTPLPPRQSGIADYSAALLPRLAENVDLEVFVEETNPPAGPLRTRHFRDYRPEEFDLVLYQVGNNPDHTYLYDVALEHPGVVTLHEFNLHHLVAAATITRGDWDEYLREVERNGGPEALAHARRVKAREVGPDYENLPMNRRLLESSRALVVHSGFLAGQVRAAGCLLPLGVIPHGAVLDGELDPAARLRQRRQLGLDEQTPLIGIFGFLKPYKRVAPALRAFQRLVRLEPRARMILVGEEHPELQVSRLISSLGLEEHARHLGYVPLDDFQDYIAAVDICLNLRYPTAGESSGTLQRALAMGRAVLVSEVGSFAELPDRICLKVPVDGREVDFLFECLNLLVSRPEARRALGEEARRYMAANCGWDRVAGLYAGFLEAVAAGRPWDSPPAAAPAPAPEPAATAATRPATAPDRVHPWGEYILGYASASPDQLQYARRHLTRLVRTLEITPRGGPQDRILEMGAYLQITPALANLLGYGEVRGSYLGPCGRNESREVRSAAGEVFRCPIDLFNAETNCFPYPGDHFATVLCCELLEHLERDPMHMMSEINRILRPGGALVLTTPNICSLRAIQAVLAGYHPGFFHQYIQPGPEGDAEPRHNREYAPREIGWLLEQSGFEVALLETGPYQSEPSAAGEWVWRLLDQYQLPAEHRGEAIYAVGRKVGPVKCRFPAGLYAGAEG